MSLYYRRKKLADIILVSSIVCLMFCIFMSYFFDYGIMLRGIIFVSEAVLVASVADYIAITAINKKILWFNSTGIIPKKRLEIIESIMNAIKEKVLTKQSISVEIEKIDVMEVFLNENVFKLFFEHYLKENLKNNASQIANYTNTPIKNALKRLDFQKIYPLLQTKTTRDTIDPYLINLSNFLIQKVASKEFNVFLNRLIIEGSKQKKDESSISKLALFIGEKTNIINYEDMSKEIIESLIVQLKKLSNIESRSERDEVLEKVITSVITGLESKQVSKELYKFKMKEIDKIDFESITLSLLATLSERADEIAKIADENSIFDRSKMYIINEMPNFEKEIKHFLSSLLEIEYDTVIELVGLILNRLSDKDLTKKINEVAGADLQWIRISGSLVGFFCGLICFLIIEFPGFMAPMGILIALAIRFLPKMQKILVGYKYS